MKYTQWLICVIVAMSSIGCTSHSWTQIDRTYVANYTDVFEKVPVEAKNCMMSLKKSEPEAGLIVLNARRIHDQILTASLFNLIAGDEVIVKVQRVGPMTTKVHIDSKAHGQIGPDLGRTDRNVMNLAEVLDRVWAQVKEMEEERGEKRPGVGTESKQEHLADGT